LGPGLRPCRLASFPTAAHTAAEKRRRACRTRVLELACCQSRMSPFGGLWSATDVWDATDAEADTLGEPHRSEHQSFTLSQAAQGPGLRPRAGARPTLPLQPRRLRPLAFSCPRGAYRLVPYAMRRRRRPARASPLPSAIASRPMAQRCRGSAECRRAA